jgi:hypothetical protein
MSPLVVKAQRKESPMNARLAALVKHVSELRTAELKACHCIEKVHHRRHACKCPWMVDPNLEPADGKHPTLSLEYWGPS